MTRWEYSVDGFNRWTEPQLRDALDQRGAQGWELVAINWDMREMVFKRPAGEV